MAKYFRPSGRVAKPTTRCIECGGDQIERKARLKWCARCGGDAVAFGSATEYSYWRDSLKVQRRAGHIAEVQFHPRFRFQIQAPYKAEYRDVLVVADFAWFEGGRWRVVDVKAPSTRQDRESLRNHRLVACFPWRWDGKDFVIDHEKGEILKIELLRWRT
jgi:hypothetical protein